MKKAYFIFDGLNSSDYGVYISAGMAFSDAEDDFEKVEIPGRSGDLLIPKNRFRNRSGKYPAFIFARDEEGLSKKVETFRNAIGSKRGYYKLFDSYNPDSYMLAAYAGGLEVSPKSRNRVAEFDVQFDCKPQRFLMTGDNEIEYTADGTIHNPTLFSSKPLLAISGYGTLTIGDYTVEITGTAGTVMYIDCDIMEAYSFTGQTRISRNTDVETGPYFPELKPGLNEISMDASITKVVITPRWWKK